MNKALLSKSFNETQKHRFTLRFFDSDLEKGFQAHIFQSRLVQLRVAMPLGAFMYSIYGYVDQLITPELMATSLTIRSGIVFPYLMIILFFSFSRTFEKYWIFLTGFGGLMATIGTACIVTMSNETGKIIITDIFTYINFWILLLTGLPFFSAIKFTLISLSIFEINFLLYPYPQEFFISHNFFLWIGFILGAIPAYLVELQSRRAFINLLTIEKEVEERKQAEKSLKSNQEILEKMNTELETQNWFKLGLTELNASMQGEQDIHELGKNILTATTGFLKVPKGAIFISTSENSLDRIANHAYSINGDSKNTFKFGEGLVGQAAVSGNSIIINDIAKDHGIAFGIGELPAGGILVYPLMIKNQVVGVIELISFEPFSENQKKWVEEASKIIALSIHTGLHMAENSLMQDVDTILNQEFKFNSD